MKIFVKYLPGTEELYYKTEGSACADLRYFDFDGSKPELLIFPGETVMIHTGVSMWINDPKFTALVFPRSGLGSKGLVLANTVGVIDADYCDSDNEGHIIVSLVNPSGKTIELPEGKAFAQGIVVKYEIPEGSESCSPKGACRDSERLRISRKLP